MLVFFGQVASALNLATFIPVGVEGMEGNLEEAFKLDRRRGRFASTQRPSCCNFLAYFKLSCTIFA